MLKNLLLAAVITFSLNVFLEVRSPSETMTATKPDETTTATKPDLVEPYFVEMPTTVVKLAKSSDCEPLQKLAQTLAVVQANLH